MFIGASMNKEEIDAYRGYLVGNDIMRIFPSTQTIAGKSMKVLPGWTDSRFAYCQDVGAIPFVSTKVDGDTDGLAYVKSQLQNMPSWITQLYITDRHEPEGDSDMTASTYQSNFNAFLAMINSLPSTLRQKIKCGPVLTKTWTEDTGSGKGNFNYSTWDPGTGDFFGVDMYVESGTSSAVVKPSTIPSVATFTQTFKAYKKNSGDTRPRMWPELGLIGMPDDTDGTARANWITGLYNEVKTWGTGTTGWPWLGWIWWHATGKATGVVQTIGQRRDFPLHLRTVNSTSATTLPGNPPAPVAAYNAAYTAEHSGTGPTPIEATIGTVTGLGTAGRMAVAGGTTNAVTSGYLVGATLKKEEIGEYEPKLARNNIMRIFPNSNGLPPDWSDPRFAYCQRNGTIPFVSSNIDGDATKFPLMRQWIIDMPSWVKVLYLSDRHEPENNQKDGLTRENYLANFTAWWNQVIQTLPSETRLKVRAGQILTKQYIENPSKNTTYAEWDTGLGDFFGVDMYHDSWMHGGGTNATKVFEEFEDPVSFLAGIKAYRRDAGDTRDRIFAEMGAIGPPADPDGSKRAAWIRGVCAQLDTWTTAAQGWRFVGWLWWNTVGTSGPSLTPIGTTRYFYLDKWQQDSTGPKPLPGSPPAPLLAYNELASIHTPIPGDPVTGGGPAPDPVDPEDPPPDPDPDPDPEPDPEPDPDPVPDPDPIPVDPGNLPAEHIPSAKAMAAEYTLLITDRNLNVVGDPVSNWLTLDLTLRFNEPSSGQFTCPGYSWVRDQLGPGTRVVCIRRVLGTAKVVLAGPVESVQFERADDGDNGGDGMLTVTWADDLAWLAGRLTYPNPALAPTAQTTDFWTWNGNAELGMLSLVNGNAGPNALTARRVPRMIVAPAKGVGSTVVVSSTLGQARFIPVTDCLRDMAERGGGLGFRTYQTMSAKQIVFEVYQPRDLSNVVRFSFGLGNLKYLMYEQTMPEATAVIVGGQYNSEDVAAGADKFVMEVRDAADETAWGRMETYLPRPGNDPQADLTAEANQELADKGESSRLSNTAADTVDQRYGVHYDLGDRASIEFWTGAALTDVIRLVHIQAWPTAGEVVSTTVGTQSTSYESAANKQLRAINRRVGHLERNVAIKKTA